MNLADMPFGAMPELTAEQQQAVAYFQQRQAEIQLELMDAQRFFAPVLCDCVRRRDPADTRPPQLHCVIHGTVMIDPRTGEIW